MAGIAIVIAILAVTVARMVTTSPQSTLGAVNTQNTTNSSAVSTSNLIVGPRCNDGYASPLCTGNGAGIASGNYAFNGVVSSSSRINFVQGTTTPCDFDMANTASSSLAMLTINIPVGTTTAGQFVIATSSSAFATTSGTGVAANTIPGGVFSIAANLPSAFVWDGGANNSQLGTSTHIVVGVQGGGPVSSGGFFYPGATCQMTQIFL